MGHTQCVSKAAEPEPQTRRTDCWRQKLGSFGHSAPKATGVPAPTGHMILPNRTPEKSLIAVRLKDRELEPHRVESTENAERLQRALTHLSESGWYWGCIPAAEAKQLLSEALEGTFLLRDSSNPGYLLTLSVKTSLGPTHLRVEYSSGEFGFDSVVMARPRLRQFKGVVELVQHYALACQRLGSVREAGQGAPAAAPETTLQLKLTRPLHKMAPSLQHLCRMAINQHSHGHQDLPLPERLKDFLLEYPFVL